MGSTKVSSVCSGYKFVHLVKINWIQHLPQRICIQHQPRLPDQGKEAFVIVKGAPRFGKFLNDDMFPMYAAAWGHFICSKTPQSIHILQEW